MRLLFLSILFLAFFTCCNESGASAGGGKPIVEGELTNSAGKSIIFEKLTANSIVPLDTIQPDEKGRFEIYDGVDEPGFYRLFADQQNFVILVLDSSSSVKLTADASKMATTVEIKGDKDSERLQELYAEMRKRDRFRDSLQMVLQNNMNNPDVETVRMGLQKEYEANEQKRSGYLTSYIEEDPSSLNSLIAISSLQFEQHPEVYKKVYNELPKRYPNSGVVQPFLQAYQEFSRTAAGEPAPDIVMPTPTGETFKLSDLKGKYVLVDFWASWCKPCRVENPNVVRMYEKYKDKGFEILGVSLDKEKDAWVQAIQADNLGWKHVSDLAFWNSSVVKTYSISGIPYTVLVDPEGRIIAKGLRGEALENKLAELLGEK